MASRRKAAETLSLAKMFSNLSLHNLKAHPRKVGRCHRSFLQGSEEQATKAQTKQAAQAGWQINSHLPIFLNS
jgi:hypothetical protein